MKSSTWVSCHVGMTRWCPAAMEAPKATGRGDWSRLSASVSYIWGTVSLGGYEWVAVGGTGWLVGGVRLWLLAGPQAGDQDSGSVLSCVKAA